MRARSAEPARSGAGEDRDSGTLSSEGLGVPVDSSPSQPAAVSSACERFLPGAGAVRLPWVLEPPASCLGSRPLSSPGSSVCVAFGATSPESDPRGYVACCVSAGEAMKRMLREEGARRATAAMRIESSTASMPEEAQEAGGEVSSSSKPWFGNAGSLDKAESAAMQCSMPRPLLVVNTCGWVKGAGLLAL